MKVWPDATLCVWRMASSFLQCQVCQQTADTVPIVWPFDGNMLLEMVEALKYFVLSFLQVPRI